MLSIYCTGTWFELTPLELMCQLLALVGLLREPPLVGFSPNSDYRMSHLLRSNSRGKHAASLDGFPSSLHHSFPYV